MPLLKFQKTLTILFVLTSFTANSSSYNWKNISQEQYIDNLVDCQLDLQRFKWSKNIWPKDNINTKPAFNTVVDYNEIRQQVLDNLKMQSLLLNLYNIEIDKNMLQQDLYRMANNTKDSKGLKQLFSLFDNDATTIAQCISRPFIASQRLKKYYNFDNYIHKNQKDKAQQELQNYLDDNLNELTAQTNLATFTVNNHQTSVLVSGNKTQTIELNDDDFLRQVKLLKNAHLIESSDNFSYSRVLNEKKNELVVQTLTWRKKSFDHWFKDQASQLYFIKNEMTNLLLPEIKKNNKVFNGIKATTGDSWEYQTYAPFGRVNHTAVWTGTEMIIWGGSIDAQKSNTGGRYNPVTDNWQPVSIQNTPTKRVGHTAVWTGSEMIIWGGRDNTGYVNNGGRYNPNTDTWLPIVVDPNTPESRGNHTAVWTGSEMLIWGGNNFSTGDYFNTGGRYNPNTDTWLSMSTSADVPDSRYKHTAIWTGDAMVVWGGYNGFSNVNTGGRYNPSTNTWKPTGIGANVPSSRSFHTAVWSGDDMIIWGGTNFDKTGGRYNPNTDTWQSTIIDSNTPDPRDYHSAIWSGSEMIIWGGQFNENSGGRYNPMTNMWYPINTATIIPINRRFHTAIWSGNEMIIWGGVDNANNLPNIANRYVPNLDDWLPSTNDNVLVERSNHVAIWTGNEMVVWGGGTGPGFILTPTNTGGRYNPVTDNWQFTSTGINVPNSRLYPSVIWSGSEMIIWGGHTPLSNTGGRYNPLTDAWQPVSTLNAPDARYGHTAIWSGNDMVVWGGAGINNNSTNTGSRYNPNTDIWTTTSTASNVPDARLGHSAIWSGNEMIIWGGLIDVLNGGVLNSGARYNPTTDNWITLNTSAITPSSRYSHTAIWSGDKMIIWGGNDGNNPLGTGALYQVSSDSWHPINNSSNSPSARFGHTMIWTGEEVIVWGGYNNINYTNTGANYDPNLNAWHSTSIGTNVPSERLYHTAIWAGDKMIIWAGTSQEKTNSLGIYHPKSILLFQDGFE